MAVGDIVYYNLSVTALTFCEQITQNDDNVITEYEYITLPSGLIFLLLSGSMANFSCVPGYEYMGNTSAAVCGDNGSWSGHLATCRSRCQKN